MDTSSTDAGRKAESPVPSITLQITKEDAESFLEAANAMSDAMLHRKPSPAKGGDKHQNNAASKNGRASSQSSKPLHEVLYEASRSSDNEALTTFIDRMIASHLPLPEVKAGTILFYDMPRAEKLKHLFEAFNDDEATGKENIEPTLTKQGMVSLFRSVLTAISCCCMDPHDNTNDDNVIVEGQPDKCDEPPTKRTKREDETATTKAMSDAGSAALDFRSACQSPSFDSSLATLRDEDEKEALPPIIRREIEEVAEYAADEVLHYAKDKRPAFDNVSLAAFEEWYSDKGDELVPWMALLEHSKWNATNDSPSRRTDSPSFKLGPDSSFESPGSLMNEDDSSRTLVSFDFSGSSLCINISEDNIYALRDLVQRTGLMHCPAADICKRLVRLSTHTMIRDITLLTLRRCDFERSIGRILSSSSFDNLDKNEKIACTKTLVELFALFERSKSILHADEADLQEFAVGFCFFCKGNKSAKLATGFEMLDNMRVGYLSEEQLLRYLKAYLTMLVAMSLLTPQHKRKNRPSLTPQRLTALRRAVDDGAKWTMGHFLKYVSRGDRGSRRISKFSFEMFADWYSTGGYSVAPWLELLDLNKVLSLVSQKHPSEGNPTSAAGPFMTERRPVRRDRVSTLRRHHSSRRHAPPPEVLFTFPLAAHRSLIVLKDDALYVRGVVEQLGLLSLNPDELWASLLRSVEKRRKPRKGETAIYVNMNIFVECMEEICPPLSRKRSAPGHNAATPHSPLRELLSNFFQCFDLDQADNVPIDELMGGLTLLCGGKKSTKLSFAFGVFDTRPGIQAKKRRENVVHSLSGEDLFLFLRSILIVTFSCCRQSLDMSDSSVGRCIADTANMICNDVMRHQWDLRQTDRLNFDEFGQWYNDGGFERAPWLELLDLKKWVLVENFDSLQKQAPGTANMHEGVPPPPPQLSAPPVRPRTSARPTPPASSSQILRSPRANLRSPNARYSRSPKSPGDDLDIPPPPPEDSLDPSFFDVNGIMPMDSMDDMDMFLMQQDRDLDIGSPRGKIDRSFSFSPRQQRQQSPEKQGNPLRFHLITNEEDGGYMLSFSHNRICHLRRILEDTGLHNLEAEACCNKILSKATRSTSPKLSKDAFESAMRSIIGLNGKSESKSQRVLFDVLSSVFTAFDRHGKGKLNAIEVACGFTVLCHGKKSDKLEFAFEVLDKRKQGRLCKEDMINYMQSFLTVLLSISFSPYLDNDPADDTVATMKGQRCERTDATIAQATEAAAEWASSMAFEGYDRRNSGQDTIDDLSMSFDDFAEWYTTSGYSSIPWLELLDLQKWVFTADTA